MAKFRSEIKKIYIKINKKATLKQIFTVLLATKTRPSNIHPQKKSTAILENLPVNKKLSWLFYLFTPSALSQPLMMFSSSLNTIIDGPSLGALSGS
jgi:hypothetical protein